MNDNEGDSLPIEDAEYEVATRPSTAPVIDGMGTGMLTAADIARAEAMVSGIKKLKSIALTVTSYSDWQKFGSKGYLMDSGCQKVGRLFGLDWGTPEFEQKDEVIEGKPVRTYICKIVAMLMGKKYPQIGVVNSNMQFYSKKNEWVNNEKIEHEIPFSERDFVKMQKHAQTNAMARGLHGLLGLNGIPWEEVEQILGAGAAKKAGAVDFDKKKKFDDQKPAPATAEQVDMRTEIRRMILDLVQDVTLAPAKLQEFSSFKKQDGSMFSGYTEVAKISEKSLPYTYKKVKEAWEKEEKGAREPGQEG